MDVSQTVCANIFGPAARTLGIEALKPVAYQVRHSGASADPQSNRRDLDGVQKRGRWTAKTSVKRYSKGGRLAQQFARLPAPVRNHCLSCHKDIGRILGGPPLPLPG